METSQPIKNIMHYSVVQIIFCAALDQVSVANIINSNDARGVVLIVLALGILKFVAILGRVLIPETLSSSKRPFCREDACLLWCTTAWKLWDFLCEGSKNTASTHCLNTAASFMLLLRLIRTSLRPQVSIGHGSILFCDQNGYCCQAQNARFQLVPWCCHVVVKRCFTVRSASCICLTSSQPLRSQHKSTSSLRPASTVWHRCNIARRKVEKNGSFLAFVRGCMVSCNVLHGLA